MSRDKRGVVNPVVGGSSPPATANRKTNPVISKLLAPSLVAAKAFACPAEEQSLLPGGTRDVTILAEGTNLGNDALLSSPLPGMNDSAEATLQAGNEALRFESDLLRREAKRLVTVNRTLGARLALAVSEADVLRQRVDAMERSRPWRLAVLLRRWLGRQW